MAKDVEQFCQDLKTNAVLKNAVQKIEETVCNIAETHGYDFTHDELMEFLEEKWGADFEADNDNPDEPQTCTCI